MEGQENSVQIKENTAQTVNQRRLDLDIQT